MHQVAHRTPTAMEQAQGEAYENKTCPLCNQPGQQFHERDGYFIDNCLNCGFIYVRNVPSDEALAAAYESYCGEPGDEYEPDDRFHKKLKNWWFAKRIRSLAKGGRVLEVGYADGNLLKALQREGVFEIEGID